MAALASSPAHQTDPWDRQDVDVHGVTMQLNEHELDRNAARPRLSMPKSYGLSAAEQRAWAQFEHDAIRRTRNSAHSRNYVQLWQQNIPLHDWNRFSSTCMHAQIEPL
jgi:hypothetical protein